MTTIRKLDAVECSHYLESLADVLVDCVAGGASVGFMPPFAADDAKAFFEHCIDDVESDKRIMLAGFVDGELVGTVQVVTAMPPNQPHRADVTKLLVRRDARRNGIGRELMLAVERTAKAAGKTLLVLDTATGDAAERLYIQLGWTRVGAIPQYALYPGGEFCDTTVFYKKI